MYKFSQDHLELFFAAVRAAGGFNNNPTTVQFISAYKRLFLRSAIVGTNGNVKQRDGTQILQLSSSSYNSGKNISLDEISLMRKYDLESIPTSSDVIDDEGEINDVPDFSALSEYKLAAVSYRASFAAKKLECNILEIA